MHILWSCSHMVPSFRHIDRIHSSIRSNLFGQLWIQRWGSPYRVKPRSQDAFMGDRSKQATEDNTPVEDLTTSTKKGIYNVINK